ncbi:MAG TPA: dihydroorotase, partial [Pedobacter sp.]
MNLLLTGVTIADPNSEFNHQKCDVRVVQGKITEIGSGLKPLENETAADGQGAFLTPGFFDMNCSIGDPGFETKEDIQTASAAAQAGGFTGLAVLPHTKPVVHSKAEVEYIINKAKNNLVDIYPVGAISR